MFAAGLFVYQLVDKEEIRSGLFTYAVFTGAATVGLWRVRRWGRNVALVIAIGNMGLGTLALLAVLLSREGSWPGPAVLLVVSLVAAYLLGRPVFDLQDGAQRPL